MMNMKMMITELVLVSNDFIFVYFVSSLNSNLQGLKLKLYDNSELISMRTVHEDISRNFETKRDLHMRYSSDLFITIFYNFIQLIIDLYFTCMRIIIHSFETPIGNFHFSVNKFDDRFENF